MSAARFGTGQRVTIEYEIVRVGGTEADPWYELQMVNDYSEYVEVSETRLLNIADFASTKSVSVGTPEQESEK